MSWLENVEKRLKEKGVKVKREEERESEEREERVRQLVTRRKILPPLPKKRLFEFGKKKKEEPKKPLGGGAPEYDLVEKSGKYTYAFNLEKKVMYVWGADAKGKWGFLTPLVENERILEIHMRGPNVMVKHADLGEFNVQFMDVVVDEAKSTRIVSNLSAYSLATIDYENPSGYGEIDNFRVYLKLPIISGLPEMVCARIIEIPDITDWLPAPVAARILTLSLLPHATVIYGRPGAGKTTLLNSILNVILACRDVNLSVVETVPELQLPNKPNIHRTATMFSEKMSSMSDGGEKGLSISEAVSRAFRFERPDILVLGELRSDALRSWQEVVRSGVPALTTTHAPDLDGCIESLKSMLEAAGVPLKLTSYFKVYIEVCRTEGERTLRYVDSIYYFYKPERVAVIYGDGAVGEEKFVELISGKKTLFGSALEVYRMFKAALGVLG